MRVSPTPAEDVLWQELRGNKLGVRFGRQRAIDNFLVDFVCLHAQLVVEVDGGIHDEQPLRDEARDATLRALGFRVLRFTNSEALPRRASVLNRIREAIASAR